MNKTHWNSVKSDGAVPDDILKNLLDKAYKIVLGSLSKKKQREILEIFPGRSGASYPCFSETPKIVPPSS